MPKTIKLEPHLDSKELANRYRKAHDPVLRTHYQILWLISEGKTTTQVMEATGYSREILSRVVDRLLQSRSVLLLVSFDQLSIDEPRSRPHQCHQMSAG